ncbi:T9SS type A sorting domain-containing protein, partial [Tenacibaculum maritimum]
DISNNTNLETLNCANNNLSNLNINIGHLLNNFDATNNPNLTCIEVDDINAIPAPWYKDAIAQYSTNCNATAGVDDIFTSKLSIYPNPVNDLLRITKNQHQDIKNVHIFNMVGQKILQTDELTINCSELSKGVYILKVESTDHKTGIKKFIKN